MNGVIDLKALERLQKIDGARFVVEMLDLALGNIVDQLARGHVAVAGDDTKGVGIAMHSIAGSAGNIGAVEMELLAREGLARSEAGSPADMRLALARLDEALSRAQPLLLEAKRGYE